MNFGMKELQIENKTIEFWKLVGGKSKIFEQLTDEILW